MRFSLALAPLLLLAGCGGGDSATNNQSEAAAPALPNVPPPAGQQWVDVVSATPEGGYRMGNPNAAIKLVEYGSRTCPHCAEFSEKAGPPLKAMIATGKLSLEFRDFLRNGADMSAALLAQCGGPGPYFALTEQMYADQASTMQRLQALTPDFYSRLQSLPPAQQSVVFAEAAGYLDFVKQRGIPEAKARVCLADAKAGDALTKLTQDAIEKKQIQGTPTFLINDEVVPNTASWEALLPALRARGA